MTSVSHDLAPILDWPNGVTDVLLLVILVQWLYLPGYLCNTWAMMWGKWLPKTGFGPWVIDRGIVTKDGKRLLGDGKTWNGLIGGSLTSGLLVIVMELLVRGRENSEDTPFISLLAGVDSSDWYWMGNEWLTLFLIGSLLGFGGLFGDLVGSFIKRRKGYLREGDVSSRAPLLDTIPFAISAFVFGLLFLRGSVTGELVLVVGMAGLLLLTPLIHKLFNWFGYKLGWKEVPY